MAAPLPALRWWVMTRSRGVVGAAEDLAGAVPAAVVDHDQFDLARVVDRQRLLEGIRDAFFLVVDRHEDRQLHGNLHGGDNMSAIA